MQINSISPMSFKALKVIGDNEEDNRKVSDILKNNVSVEKLDNIGLDVLVTARRQFPGISKSPVVDVEIVDNQSGKKLPYLSEESIIHKDKLLEKIKKIEKTIDFIRNLLPRR